jgi:hypothetical protein
LQGFFRLELFKDYLLLVVWTKRGEEGVAFDVTEPHCLPVDITHFLLLSFVVGLDHDLGTIVEADEGAHLLWSVCGSKGEVAKFGAVELSGQV